MMRNAQHMRDWSSRHQALAPPPTRGYGACVLLRLGGLWPGLRGLTIKLPLVAFPAGVNAEGVMVFVNARSARGRATERQVIEVHPPAAVPRVQRRARCKAQLLQVRLGFVERGGRLRWPIARRVQGCLWVGGRRPLRL